MRGRGFCNNGAVFPVTVVSGCQVVVWRVLFIHVASHRCSQPSWSVSRACRRVQSSDAISQVPAVDRLKRRHIPAAARSAVAAVLRSTAAVVHPTDSDAGRPVPAVSGPPIRQFRATPGQPTNGDSFSLKRSLPAHWTRWLHHGPVELRQCRFPARHPKPVSMPCSASG